MDPFTIAALVSTLAGAAMQYKSSTDASKRATQETQRALARQAELQRQAEQRALENAEEFKTEDRVEKQEEIAQDLNTAYMAPVESAQSINQAATTTQGNVSSDYLAAKAQSSANTMANARKFSSLMSKMNSADRLRQNEGFGLIDTAADISRLGSFSRGDAAADDIAIRNAARPDAGMQLAGSLLGTAGSAGLMYGQLGGAAEAAKLGGANLGGTGDSVLGGLAGTWRLG